MVIETMRCPKCGESGSVNCWRVLRLHCQAYRMGGRLCGEPYGSVNDEDHLEADGAGLARLDCDGCKHQWAEPFAVPVPPPEPVLDFVI